MRKLAQRISQAFNPAPSRSVTHLAPEQARWCSQDEIERRIAQPTPSMRAALTQDEMILMRRAELDRLQEAAQHEIPSYAPCLCCAVIVVALVLSLLLLSIVPYAHEFPLHLYSSRKTTDAPTTSTMSMDTDDDATADVFSAVNSSTFDDTENTRVFQIYDR
ncbi:hypothetical protein HPB50_007630 [Hyalomma asiaticum]|uniref:Uncharacterized protein n=1 Tax=Hyalomma asiaticum TaxID=266040 RepID=A0ACB7RZ29_HYAAI|nr:hypothetical protein HPB50_007630 [Hyalomma asiaticum]